MINPKQFTTLVVRPTLKHLGLYSRAAEQLVVGTIYQESRGSYLKQLHNGPALGLIQMEPATYHDIWTNYLAYKRALSNTITDLASMASLDDNMTPDVRELVTNLAFAVAMCRVHYLRQPEALPPENDIQALSEYWKAHYNTVHGAGRPEEFYHHFPTEILTC